MADRATLARTFLETTPWAGGQLEPLAGDASNRRYDRVRHPQSGKTAVLMDAPPESGEDVRPFARIARHLRGIGLSAPEILAEAPGTGFLLLEDLGDDLYTRVLRREPELERELYAAATDVLIALHDAPLPSLEPNTPDLLAEHADLVFAKYAAPIAGQDNPSLRARFEDRFSEILAQTVPGAQVLVQRDYHADNLLWLPSRSGVARVGLLDFQDAVTGHPAFDLMSLLQDARRDVPAGIEAAMIRRYIAATGIDDHGFRTAYAVLGAQRSLRILGVFGRLALDLGKPHYLVFMPRVWRNLCLNLEHPALAPVADMLLNALPPPTPDNLARLSAS